MLHWLKPCPRCRAGHLLEERDVLCRLVTCLYCGYVLTPDEVRFLAEDLVRANEPSFRRTPA